MKNILILFVLVLGLGAGGCGTLESPGQADPQAGLDRLFARLQNAGDVREAQLIETAIRNVWANSGRPAVDEVMVQGFSALEMSRFDVAEERFGRAIDLAPDFVEGWHMRALARYMDDNYGGAMLDLREVLAREPRHFGAMVGLGEILVELGRDELALRVFEYALRLNPYLGAARAEITKIRGKLSRNTI